VRHPATGTVRLHLEDPLPRDLEMQLMDVSASGFRAAHRSTALSCGQSVRFHHAKGAGSARVAWNLVLPDRVETGFMVVRQGIE